MDAINTENMEQYFQLLIDTLEQNNLTNASQQLYNVDESEVPLDTKGLNLVTATGSKNV